MGGVYNSINLDAYQYCGQNPVKYVDPDGRFINIIVGAGISMLAEKLTNKDSTWKDIVVAGLVGGATSAVCPIVIGKSVKLLAVALKTGVVSSAGSTLHQAARNIMKGKEISENLLSSAAIGFFGGFVSGAIVSKVAPIIHRFFGKPAWMVKTTRELEYMGTTPTKLSSAVSAAMGDSANTISQNTIKDNTKDEVKKEKAKPKKVNRHQYYNTWERD